MRIGFVSLPVRGHLNPMLTLARKLKSRGHDVVVFSIADTEAVVLGAGLMFVPLCEQEYPVGTLHEVERLHSQQQGEAALQFTFGLMAQVTASLLRPLAAALRREEIEGVVLDTYQPYLELAPIHTGTPYVHVANAAYFDTSGETPLCFFDWTHEDSTDAKARNLAGVDHYKKLLASSLSAAKDYAQEVGLTVDWGDPAATLSKLAWLTQIPEEFDFSSTRRPQQFSHTGPFHDGYGRPDVPFPWEKLSGAPLVYASMGTLQNGLENVFRIIIDVAGTHRELQFVIAMGDKLDRSMLNTVPDNVILVQHAPQLELLKRVTLCITHAGLNTTLEALAQGVPLVAIPVTNDQPGVAARIAAAKVGVFLPLAELTELRLSTLVDEVLGDASYRDNALHIQSAIFATDGLSLAADLIEEAFNGVITVEKESEALAR
jgi:zeaxanthin glucosyltransferase